MIKMNGMMTPVDYWRNGVELWFRAAEMQIDMSCKMMGMMPGWNLLVGSSQAFPMSPVLRKPSVPRPEPAPAALRIATSDKAPAKPALRALDGGAAAKPAPPAAAEKPAAVAELVTEAPAPAKAAPTKPAPAKPARKPAARKPAAKAAPAKAAPVEPKTEAAPAAAPKPAPARKPAARKAPARTTSPRKAAPKPKAEAAPKPEAETPAAKPATRRRRAPSTPAPMPGTGPESGKS